MCRLPPVLAAAAVAVLAVLAVPEAAAQQPACACPEPLTQAGFEPEKYLGSWYEMKRVPRDFEDDGQCGMAHYSWVTNASDAASGINVLNSNYVPKTQQVTTVNLLGKPDDINNGKLLVTFPSVPGFPASKYWVLGTDYTTYAVVFSCQNPATATVPHVTLWVLGRDPSTFTADVDAKATALIKSVGLDPSILKTVQHHQGCPSATCSQCPSAMANLDLTKLKGRWLEVQHSPYSTDSDKQSCSLAEVAATSDGLSFTSTTYEMSSATDGADKSTLLEAKWADAAKKDGAFNINNSGGKICVLDTDYDNWAVLSVCVPSTGTTTPAPGPSAMGTPAAAGGVFVMSRRRGLTAAQQLEANKAVTNAGIPAASMEATPSTPCPAAALKPNGAATSATVTSAVLLLSVLATVLGHFGPAQ